MKSSIVDITTVGSQSIDLLVVPAWEGEKKLTSAIPDSFRAHFGDIEALVRAEAFTGKWQQTVLLRTQEKKGIQRVLLCGAGKRDKWTIERARRMIGTATQTVQKLKFKTLGVVAEPLYASTAISSDALTQALVESVVLSSYQYAAYKTDKDAHKAPVASFIVAVPKADISAAKQGAALGEIFARATVHARDLINSPANRMTPTVLLQQARALASTQIAVKGYNREAMKKLGMNTILAVAAGSEQEPYLIHLRYTPKNGKAKMKFALCGKGITFDSGGLQVKPGVHMDGMKYDMAAAGMIIGIFSVLQELQPNIEFHGVIPATENMASGNAMKPGDVVVSYSGKTIEIGHTDAEGRLVLADALAWTEDVIKPDIIVDAATLTGAAIYALGQEYAGCMSVDEPLLDTVRSAADSAGELLWPLPLVEDYEQFLESKIADLNNLPPVNWAGSTMGGMFLQKFVEHTPWVHLDIAGPAWVERSIKAYNPEGASGFGVRMFLHMLRDLSGKAWKK